MINYWRDIRVVQFFLEPFFGTGPNCFTRNFVPFLIQSLHPGFQQINIPGICIHFLETFPSNISGHPVTPDHIGLGPGSRLTEWLRLKTGARNPPASFSQHPKCYNRGLIPNSKISPVIVFLIGGLEPFYMFSIGFLILSTDELIFFRGVPKNHQPVIISPFDPPPEGWKPPGPSRQYGRSIRW